MPALGVSYSMSSSPKTKWASPKIRWLKRIVFCVSLFAALVLALIAVATYETVTHLGGSTIDCGVPPPYIKPSFPNQALFTAHVLYVGHVESEYAVQVGHRFGPWALAHVKHRYWGLPWWSSMFVVLAPGWYQQGEDYFVDGTFPGDSRFIPFVSAGPCRRTRPLSEAVVDTRVLAAGPPRDGVRIIGRSYRRGSNTAFEPAPGMRLQISGPNGAVFVTSDAEAVYDLTGVPAGRYGIRIEQPDRRNREEGDQEKDLATGEVWGRDVYSR